ncbi:sporulation protein [Chitinilyticum litopenaei]|uniref:sporulation protein n=1 Tax=Chitinilyticum litopenaei TaxID=1121276 RepID=UPI0003F7DC1E|nr:sporulation protein [Chitinilyticum litopenaei]
MFKKLFAAMGVGGAEVDTVLENPSLRPGDTLRGHVQIKGGSVEQTIEHVDLVLMAEVEAESGDHEARVARPLASFRAAGSTRIAAGQEIRLPFALPLPLETPVNNPQALASPGSPWAPQVRAAVWIHTDLAIASAVDASDRDWLDVQPLPQMQALIAAMARLGYAHASTDVEAGTARIGHVTSTLGCYQEFEFRPVQGGFSSVQEVEITCIPRPEGVHVLVEIDRRFRGDSYRSFVMSNDWQTVNWDAQLRSCLG